MKWWGLILLACFAVGAPAAEQIKAAAFAVPVVGSASAHRSVVRILSPAPNQQLNNSTVEVTYELVTPVAHTGGFQVQLDGGNVITTKSASHTFSGVSQGRHLVTIQLLDANEAPIAGARSTVEFSTAPVAADLHTPAANNGEQPEVAPASNALPLLSIIGFGVLLGGVATAMRTRG